MANGSNQFAEFNFGEELVARLLEHLIDCAIPAYVFNPSSGSLIKEEIVLRSQLFPGEPNGTIRFESDKEISSLKTAGNHLKVNALHKIDIVALCETGKFFPFEVKMGVTGLASDFPTSFLEVLTPEIETVKGKGKIAKGNMINILDRSDSIKIQGCAADQDHPGWGLVLRKKAIGGESSTPRELKVADENDKFRNLKCVLVYEDLTCRVANEIQSKIQSEISKMFQAVLNEAFA